MFDIRVGVWPKCQGTKASTKSPERVVSYVLMVRERLEKLCNTVRENLANAQVTQEQWYNRNTRYREFQPGDQVLILLPTCSNKLLAEWHGPYSVVRKISDVNSEVKLTEGRKRNHIFHVNMLREWHSPSAEEITEGVLDDMEDIVITDDGEQPSMSGSLSPA